MSYINCASEFDHGHGPLKHDIRYCAMNAWRNPPFLCEHFKVAALQGESFCKGRPSLALITSAKEVMFLLDFVCLSVCLSVSQQDNSKSYGRIFLKFSGNAGSGKDYQWFQFGGDPKGILDSGSLWNFR